jgi:4-hydroxy-3-methylbut-2-enyl diphosphate reductase
MRILLAEPRGFCAGVTMAVQSLEHAVEQFGTPIYVYHEIVHNTWIVENFRSKGVLFVDTLDDVPHGSRLMFSAHGVSPEIRKIAEERKLETIDATCPLVNKVHHNAIDYAEQGYKIILIGHRGHDEVVGVVGEVPDSIWVVENDSEIDVLPFGKDEKLAYLTQTTLSVTETFRRIERLKERFPQIMGPPQSNICYATQSRQDAVREQCPNVNVVIVVGSRSSSNSRRLAEQAEALGVRSFLVDDSDGIPLHEFVGTETVLITAGASAPEHLVQGCVELLKRQFGAAIEG